MTDPANDAVVLFRTLPTAGGRHFGVATLNAPASLNALSVDMVRLLTPQLRAWAADDGIVGVLLDAAGEKAFCAGGDLRALYVGWLAALSQGDWDPEQDDDRLEPRQISLGKLNNVREALQIARECRTILGANGITLDYPVMRHANNLESVLTYEGTSEVHQLIIGQALTGESAFQ